MLDVSKIQALAPDDFRRTAYLNLNATSRVWLSVLPDYDNALTNAEFAEVSARYFGARGVLIAGLRRGEGPSIWSRAEDGRRIRVRRECVVPGGGGRRSTTGSNARWRSRPARWARRSRWRCAEGSSPPTSRSTGARRCAPATRTRHGLVPDFMILGGGLHCRALWIRLGRDPVKLILLLASSSART